jgi:hypothetical protein
MKERGPGAPEALNEDKALALRKGRVLGSGASFLEQVIATLQPEGAPAIEPNH